MDIINEVIETVREQGTYIHALLKFGDQIKKFDWEYQKKELFTTLANLIEEEDTVIYDVLRILYLSKASFFFREKVIVMNHRNLLETAIYADNWNMANFLIKFALENDSELNKSQFWNPDSTHKAIPDLWGKALQILVKSHRFTGENGLQATHGISHNSAAHLWAARFKHVKSVADNGYVTLLELIKYPSAFMLMVRLGADLTVQNDGASNNNMTLLYYIWSSRMNKVKRTHLLKFLESVDPALFDIPCGPNNVELMYECLRTSDLAVIRSIKALQSKVDMNMRDSKGRGIGYYLHPKMIFDKKFTSEELFDYALNAVCKGNIPAINYLLQADTGAVQQYLKRYPELMKALEILIRKDKRVLSKFLEGTRDPFFIAYCVAQGHEAPKKNTNDWRDAVKLWKLDRKDNETSDVSDTIVPFNKDQQCPIPELPNDIIALIMLEIKFEEIMCLFSTSKLMQQTFQRMKSPSLWKTIAANNFNGFKMKYLLSQPITDWQSHVVREMRWRNNWNRQRFTERTIFTEAKEKFYCFAADDNWFVMTRVTAVYCWNCHTFQTLTMAVEEYNLGDIHIVSSTPTELTIAISGYDWLSFKSMIIVLDPPNNHLVTVIEPSVTAVAELVLFKYRSKLCYIAPDLFEVDLETGVTKLVKTIDYHNVGLVAVNLEEDSLLFTQTSGPRHDDIKLLDPDMNIFDAKLQPPEQNILSRALQESWSVFTICSSMLDFGQWHGQVRGTTTFHSFIDAQNSRLLIKQSSGGISLLLHPNLKTWYTAWVETPQKFMTMNSRYLFLYDETTGCVYCRDFDWANLH